MAAATRASDALGSDWPTRRQSTKGAFANGPSNRPAEPKADPGTQAQTIELLTSAAPSLFKPIYKRNIAPVSWRGRTGAGQKR